MNYFTFAVQQCENGWLVTMAQNNAKPEPLHVFKTLDEMNDWLKAKYESTAA